MINEINEKVMPKTPVFCVYDVKGKYFGKFFVAKTAGQATRGFEDIANDKQSEIGKHPEDFFLFQIAEWDEWKGVFTPITHVPLGCALQYVRSDFNGAKIDPK